MSKMGSHWSFGHLQPRLWAKEGPGLAVWLSTTKSRESISSRRLQMECNGTLESSQREVQLWFRPHSNRRSEPGVVSVQSLGTRDSFGTPTWESREKEPFGCGSRKVTQKILHGEGGGFPRVRALLSQVCQSARGLSQHPRVFPNVN